MKSDLDFLGGSSLNRHFNFSIDSDPFLIALSEKQEEDKPNKIILDIDEDLLDNIKNCQFLILQDIIFWEMGELRQKGKKFNITPMSPYSIVKKDKFASSNGFSSKSQNKSNNSEYIT